MVSQLISASEEGRIDQLDFNEKDANGDSCLALAMSKGYSVESETSQQKHFWHNRRRLLELLLPRTDLRNAVSNRNNSPLHWCVFNGDVRCGMEIFKRDPMMLLEKNSHGELPFDLFFKKQVRRNCYGTCIRLVRKLVVDFTDLVADFYAADKDEEQRVMVNAKDLRLKKFYQFLIELKWTLAENQRNNQHLIDSAKE